MVLDVSQKLTAICVVDDAVSQALQGMHEEPDLLMMDTLVDLLVERGIRLKSYRPGHTEQVRCPKCDGGRTREVRAC